MARVQPPPRLLGGATHSAISTAERGCQVSHRPLSAGPRSVSEESPEAVLGGPAPHRARACRARTQGKRFVSRKVIVETPRDRPWPMLCSTQIRLRGRGRNACNAREMKSAMNEAEVPQAADLFSCSIHFFGSPEAAPPRGVKARRTRPGASERSPGQDARASKVSDILSVLVFVCTGMICKLAVVSTHRPVRICVIGSRRPSFAPCWPAFARCWPMLA